MKHNGRTFITGDLHSTIDLSKIRKSNWPTGATLSKKDILIIAGDFGFLWNHVRTKEEAYWLKWMDDCPWTTCFVDGNHENHDLLDNLQRRYLFGNKVGIVGHSVFHLLRGKIYKINGNKILTIGGAHSSDRKYREWGSSMWKQEEITQKNIDEAFKQLTIYRNVDYIISHCAPVKYAKAAIPLSLAPYWQPSHSEELLDQILDEVEFKKWFFGHYHDDVYDTYSNKWVLCYNKIHEI